MKLSLLMLVAVLAPLGLWAQAPSAASLAGDLRGLSLDPKETYHVRDVQISRGDIKLYLNEGTLSFATGVVGRTVAAVFTTAGVDAGDAEVLVMPTSASERASLATYTGSPNLDEHFDSAVFLFTDGTRDEVLRQLERGTVRRTPEVAAKLAPDWNQTLRNLAGDLDIPLMASLLNDDRPEAGVFYGLIQGRNLHGFDVIYQPHEPEPVEVGRVVTVGNTPRFRVWTSFVPRRRAVALAPPVRLSDFRIDATVHRDLSLSATTRFHAQFEAGGQRALMLDVSNRMKVTAATVDGQRAEVYQATSIRGSDEMEVSPFLVVMPQPFAEKQSVEVEIEHQGSVIDDDGEGVYYVAARNVWFPHRPDDFASFDLTFRCPENLRLVATGELVSEDVNGGIRVVHRKTRAPVRYAGFNLGDFESASADRPPFHVECFANRGLMARVTAAENPGLNGANTDGQRLREMAADAGNILDEYAKQWGPLPITNIAVSPIPGTFGQGFPGLIYLSMLSYLRENERPQSIREPLLDAFFSDILLPHEIAHQWWGNFVTANDYRSEWLMEALANYVALQRLKERRGAAALNAVLSNYQAELSRIGGNGKPVDAAGPVDMGVRLREAENPDSWRVITYDKGSWILHMLHERLGDGNFSALLKAAVAEFNKKPITSDAFRQLASRFVPEGVPDRSLELFFDSWVYGTGIPKLSLVAGAAGSGEMTLKQEGVSGEFAVDVPVVIVHAGGGRKEVKWVRSSSEGTTFDVPGQAHARLPDPADFLYRQ
jgi:hypothetical protein